jgi:hypothetical protein
MFEVVINTITFAFFFSVLIVIAVASFSMFYKGEF